MPRDCARRVSLLEASNTPAIIFALHERFLSAFAECAHTSEAQRASALLDHYTSVLIARHARVIAADDRATVELATLDRVVVLLTSLIRAVSSTAPPRCRVVRSRASANPVARSYGLQCDLGSTPR